MQNREEFNFKQDYTNSSVKFCVTAIIDLIGFSNQLEIGYRDLDSVIGETLLKRLTLIDSSLRLFEKEKAEIPDMYPNGCRFLRINDSLIFTLDLDDIFKPLIGEIHKTSYRFELGTDGGKEDLFKKIKIASIELIKFVGLVCRIHNFIDSHDKELSFPGCKTIISTGFRKVYKDFNNFEDYFSANFSFSNSYLADKHLKGGNFFIDSNILSFIAHNESFIPLLKYSHKINTLPVFNLKKFVKDESFENVRDGNQFKVELFHQDYYFDEVDSNVLSYLQVVIAIEDYLSKYIFSNEVPAFKERFSALNDYDLNKSTCLRINPLSINSRLLIEIIIILKGWGAHEDFTLPNYPHYIIS